MTTQAEGSVLIVGAGLAGLALARELTRAGQRVTVLDKARGVSGRSSTKRVQAARLDHGARFFTARDERTKTLVQEGLEAGWLAEWTRSVPKWQAGEVSQESGGHPRYVPPEGMSTLGKVLAEGVEVHTEAQVVQVRRGAEGWQAECQDGRRFGAQTLVLNLPAPQIVPLLAEAELSVAPFQAVHINPCWSVGAVLRADVVGADWPALRVQEHEALEWIAREHTKRGAGHPPALMLHARADWTTVHLQDSKEEVQSALLAAACEIVGAVDVEESFAHRWLYATPTVRFPDACGWRPELNLGWCGDWCTPDPHGPRVEAALLSGWELAETIGR